MKAKIIASVILFLGMGYASTLPLANTASVGQLSDTVTSSSNSQIASFLVANWWVFFFIFMALIWTKDVVKWYKSN